MGVYEITLILPAGATSAKKKVVKEKIEKLLKIGGGKLVSENDWGEIDLSYKIRKNKSGSFLHYKLELERSVLKDIENKLKLDDDVIRYLVVRTH